MKKSYSAMLFYGFVFVFVIGLAIQFEPYGHNHVNPALVAEPPWDSAQTRDLFFRACADCHSNQTKWPLYSNIAPASWLVQSDVDKGRSHLNVSEWGRPKNHGDEAAEEVEKGEMPLLIYTLMHSDARFSADEKQVFIQGLQATFGSGEGEQESGESEQE